MPEFIDASQHTGADYDANRKAEESAIKGNWEEWAQPGYEKAAGEIAVNAEMDRDLREMDQDIDRDEAIGENDYRDERATEDAEEAARRARDDEEDDARIQAERDAEDAQNDIDGDLEARSGITNQESIAASYHAGEDDRYNDDAVDDEARIEAEEEKVAAYVASNGKPKGYDFYIGQGYDPLDALHSALDDEAQGPDPEDLENEERERETTEDPLANDVDKLVHPDETRTDEQIAHDNKYHVEPY